LRFLVSYKIESKKSASLANLFISHNIIRIIMYDPSRVKVENKLYRYREKKKVENCKTNEKNISILRDLLEKQRVNTT